jgi:precorrin-6x reductase
MAKSKGDRLLDLIAHPPRGSKIAAAKKFGIDLTLVARKLTLTPTERLEELASAQEGIQKLRSGRKR